MRANSRLDARRQAPCRAPASNRPCLFTTELAEPKKPGLLAEVQPLCVGADAELIGEVPWIPAKAKDSPKKRLVWAHDPQRAAEQSTQREVRMAGLLSRAEPSAAKLDAQDEGKKSKGRKLSDAGARARLCHEVIEAHWAASSRST